MTPEHTIVLHAMTVAARSRVRSVRAALLAIVALAYVVWASRFIAASAIETHYGRRFCLFDDAMISLRYAWNLAHGAGLVWNPGERIEGVTSFLFTVAMAPAATFLDKSGAVLFVQLTAIPLVLGIALLARRLLRALDAPGWLGMFGAIAVLTYYPLSYWSLMGMETGLLSALALGALAIALRIGGDRRRNLDLGLLLGL